MMHTPATGTRTVWAAFAATADRHPDRTFLHVPPEACREYSNAPVSLSYREALERARAMAVDLTAAGYGAGHRVGVALDNRAEFFVCFLALNSLGISVVPLNAAMSTKELGYVIGHSNAAFVITHDGHTQALGACLPRGVPLHLSGKFPRSDVAPSADGAEAALLYTSGTSGVPKACILDNEYFLECGELYINLGGYCRFDGENDRLVTPLPVTHMNALAVSFMTMMLKGGCLIQLDRFHPSTWWDTLRQTGATAFHYLGVMPAMLLQAPPRADDDFGGAIRFGFGAGVDPRHHRTFEERFGVPLIEAWAMTETGAGAWITANHEPRHVGQRCFGKPLPDLEVRLVDDGGHEVAPGTVGELLVRRRGRNPRQGFFSGYYKDAEATREAWAQDWFHTGDLVRADVEGSLYFVDRNKNIIRRSGENIAAIEVESTLQTHPSIGAVAVCPVTDDIRGEEVCALVVLRDGIDSSRETAVALQRHCLDGLAYYKAPGYVLFGADLPRTASQKLARAQIKALCAEALRDGSLIDLRSLKKRGAGQRVAS